MPCQYEASNWEPIDSRFCILHTCFAPRGQSRQVVSPAGLGAKNDCSGEGQQEFTRPTRIPSQNFLLSFLFVLPSRLAQVVIFLDFISEVPGLNVGRATYYPNWGLSSFVSVSPDKSRDSALN
jgi:hypothetical protein